MLDMVHNTMPFRGLIGGLMIGLAAAIILVGLGRIAGVSGLAARASGIAGDGPPWPWAAAFMVGLPIGAVLMAVVFGPVQTTFPANPLILMVGGLLVGFGTRLGNGCTSGHGVCGLSRLSRRSLAATAAFMIAGVLTVGVMHLTGAAR
jgi:uncharacterized membrane protein YedE/YeeE